MVLTLSLISLATAVVGANVLWLDRALLPRKSAPPLRASFARSALGAQ